MTKQVPKEIEPILIEVKSTLSNIYGDKLKGVILYGSFARGDWYDGSDIDVMILIENMDDIVSVLEYCMDKIYDIDLKYDTVISITPVDIEAYNEQESPLVMNVSNEGIFI